MTYQMNEEVVDGRFPLNRDLALELCALMAQVGQHVTVSRQGSRSTVTWRYKNLQNLWQVWNFSHLIGLCATVIFYIVLRCRR